MSIKNTALFFLFSGALYLSFSFTLEPPQNWQQQFHTSPGAKLQYLSPDRKSNFTANLVVTINKIPVELEKDSSFKFLGKHITGKQMRLFPLYKVVENIEKKCAGLKGILIAASYAYGVLDLAAYQYFFLKDDKLYSVVYTCLLSDLARSRTRYSSSRWALQRIFPPGVS